MMTLFRHAFESVLSLSLVSWFGNLPLKDRNRLRLLNGIVTLKGIIKVFFIIINGPVG